MDLSELLTNRYALAALTFVLGVVGTIVTHQVMGRRSIFTYNVWHNRVGLSTADAVFGNIQLTWNNTPVANLYHSTVELVNQSFKDFQQVNVTVYTNDTKLLTQHTSIVDTPNIVRFSDAYAESVRVPDGQKPTQQQFDTWNRRREYIVPTFNRGQTIRLAFLNAADSEKKPTIWLDAPHAGVKVRFHSAVEQYLGVPRPRAALSGVLIGIVLLTVLLTQVERAWVVAVAAFAYGLVAQLPGALVIRGWRWLRSWYGG